MFARQLRRVYTPWILLFVVLPICGTLSFVAAADARTEPARTDFVVYASDTKATDAIASMLASGVRVTQARTLQEACRSKSDVLVLMLERSLDIEQGKSLTSADIKSLKRRKVLGIGYGAGQVFDLMGLEINGGNSMHTPDHARVVIQTNGTLTHPAAGTAITAFETTGTWAKRTSVREPLTESELKIIDYSFGIFVPKGSQMAGAVDAIARWPDLLNHAPITRQGGYILSGLAAPPSTWTPEYRDLVRDLAYALERREPEPFPVANWKLTPPGVYHIRLAKTNEADDVFTVRYYFRLTKPTHVTARLEQNGSTDVMLMLRSRRRSQFWDRQDSSGQPLEISRDIRQPDIKAAGEYCSLTVTNFDKDHGADCTVTLQY